MRKTSQYFEGFREGFLLPDENISQTRGEMECNDKARRKDTKGERKFDMAYVL